MCYAICLGCGGRRGLHLHARACVCGCVRLWRAQLVDSLDCRLLVMLSCCGDGREAWDAMKLGMALNDSTIKRHSTELYCMDLELILSELNQTKNNRTANVVVVNTDRLTDRHGWRKAAQGVSQCVRRYAYRVCGRKGLRLHARVCVSVYARVCGMVSWANLLLVSCS